MWIRAGTHPGKGREMRTGAGSMLGQRWPHFSSRAYRLVFNPPPQPLSPAPPQPPVTIATTPILSLLRPVAGTFREHPLTSRSAIITVTGGTHVAPEWRNEGRPAVEFFSASLACYQVTDKHDECDSALVRVIVLLYTSQASDPLATIVAEGGDYVIVMRSAWKQMITYFNWEIRTGRQIDNVTRVQSCRVHRGLHAISGAFCLLMTTADDRFRGWQPDKTTAQGRS